MLEFITVKSTEDKFTLLKLINCERFTNEPIGNYRFTFKESEKVFDIVIVDTNKRMIARYIVSKNEYKVRTIEVLKRLLK